MFPLRLQYISALSTVLLLSGCTLTLNRPDSLYGFALPAFDPAPVSMVDDQPSVTAGHDRSHWRSTSIRVPVRQVEHHPHYTHEFLFQASTQRGEGLLPTLDNAFEIDQHTFSRTLESPLTIVGSGALLLWAPIDMIINHRWPWTVERGPQHTYERMGVTEPAEHFRPWIDAEEQLISEQY